MGNPIDSAVASESISDDIASLDAAVAELNSAVLSLRQESEANAKLEEIVEAADIASLDAAVEKLNGEVRDLVEEEDRAASGGAIPKARDNRYFDYSLYRESSVSPPPHPLTTYRWEDIKREKEKVQRELTVNFYSIDSMPDTCILWISLINITLLFSCIDAGLLSVDLFESA